MQLPGALASAERRIRSHRSYRPQLKRRPLGRETNTVVESRQSHVTAGPIRPWIERAYWSFMLRTSSVPVRGLRFIYISALEDRPAADIRAALNDALARISAASAGFRELVTSHLRFMAALEGPKAVALVHARGYSSPCPRVEVNNPNSLLAGSSGRPRTYGSRATSWCTVAHMIPRGFGRPFTRRSSVLCSSFPIHRSGSTTSQRPKQSDKPVANRGLTTACS